MYKNLLKTAFYLFSIVRCYNVFSQQLLNSGFENWSMQNWHGVALISEPENWLSNNLINYSYDPVDGLTIFHSTLFPVEQSSDAHGGMSSVKLSVIDDYGNASIIYNEAINYNDSQSAFLYNDAVFHDVNNVAPDSVVIWYKFSGVNSTSVGLLEVYVTDSAVVSDLTHVPLVGSSLNNFIHFDPATSSNWIRKSVPITYTSLHNSNLYLTCRFLVFGDIGTTINVDDVEIIYNSSQMSLDEKNSLNLVIYPNPASENIQITFEALNEDYTISILDLQGRVLQTQAYSNLTGAQNINFKLIDLKSGKYLVKIESNKTTVSKMIVVE